MSFITVVIVLSYFNAYYSFNVLIVFKIVCYNVLHTNCYDLFNGNILCISIVVVVQGLVIVHIVEGVSPF